MVKLYTNESNPAALKLIIANNFSLAKVKLDITIVNLDGKENPRVYDEIKFIVVFL